MASSKTLWHTVVNGVVYSATAANEAEARVAITRQWAISNKGQALPEDFVVSEKAG